MTAIRRLQRIDLEQTTRDPPVPVHYAKGTVPYPHLIPFGGLIADVEDWVICGHLPSERETALRFPVCQGASGDGKSKTIANTLVRYGHVCPLPATALLHSQEGENISVLTAWLNGLANLSRVTNVECFGIVDDIDAILSRRDDVQITINTLAAEEFFQWLGDDRTTFLNSDGTPIRIALTGNAFDRVREPIKRRAHFITHKPSVAERIAVAVAVLKPETNAEREIVSDTVTSFAGERVALWPRAAAYLRQTRRRELVARHGTTNIAAIESELALHQPITREALGQAIGACLTVGSAGNFLKETV